MLYRLCYFTPEKDDEERHLEAVYLKIRSQYQSMLAFVIFVNSQPGLSINKTYLS